MEQQEFMKTVWSDMMKDRKHERVRSYIKYGLISLAVAGYALVLASAVAPVNTGPAEPYVATVRISGEIMPGKEASDAVLRPILAKAFKDEGAKAVVLVINSPGGTPVQSGLIHDQIVALKKQYHKPVIALGEDVMASGAYMIAVAADEIVVNRSTVTGSIGVISKSFGLTGLMEKLGVERRVMTAGESKNMLDPFSPQSDAERGKQAELLQGIHEHFKDTVKEGRGTRLKLDTPGLFSGTVWTGEAAVKLGVVDKLGDIETVKSAIGAKAVKEYAPARSLLNQAMSGLGVKVLEQFTAEVSTTPLLTAN